MYSLLKDMDDSDEKYRKFYLDKVSFSGVRICKILLGRSGSF
jgi:hypothetical protein